MGNTQQPNGHRVFDDVYSFPQDSQSLADDIHQFAFARGGTRAEREGLAPALVREGLQFAESDTGLTWRRSAGTWVVVSPAVMTVTRAGVQLIPNNANTDVLFPGTVVDIIGTGISLNPETGIATISVPGIYSLTALGTWAAGGAVDSHRLTVSVNNQTSGANSGISAIAVTNVLTSLNPAIKMPLKAGDTVRLKALQVSGAAKNLGVAGANYWTTFAIERVVG